MKVLVVTTWFPSTKVPGAGIFVRRDVELLAQFHDVDVLHLYGAEAGHSARDGWIEQDGYRLKRMPMSPANPAQIVAAARNIRRVQRQYELIHTMSPSALLPLVANRPSIPWVHTEHWSGLLAPTTLPLAARLSMPLILHVMRGADLIVAVSELLAARLRGGSEVVVIPNAVKAPAELVERRERFDDSLRLVSVGGLIARKGPDIAIDAVRELKHRGIDAQLEWIGDGPLKSGLEAKLVDSGERESVRLVGAQPAEYVLNALADSDVFILPTQSETFGVAIAEALASGRPVAVGGEGGHREFVKEPSGILVSEQSGAAYADAIERLLAENSGRSASSIAASLGERFTDERRASAYADAYRVAIGGRRR